MNFIIFLMQTIIKIRHPKRDFKIPFEVAKIPFELASQVQVEEIVFMAVRNFKASLLPPPAPTGGCYSSLCIIVSYCQMMAMAQACVQRLQAVSASPVNPQSAKKRPLPDSPSTLSPSNLLPLAITLVTLKTFALLL